MSGETQPWQEGICNHARPSIRMGYIAGEGRTGIEVTSVVMENESGKYIEMYLCGPQGYDCIRENVKRNSFALVKEETAKH